MRSTSVSGLSLETSHFGCLEAGAWAQIVVISQLCDMDCGRGYRRVAWWLGSGNPVAEMMAVSGGQGNASARTCEGVWKPKFVEAGH